CRRRPRGAPVQDRHARAGRARRGRAAGAVRRARRPPGDRGGDRGLDRGGAGRARTRPARARGSRRPRRACALCGAAPPLRAASGRPHGVPWPDHDGGPPAMTTTDDRLSVPSRMPGDVVCLLAPGGEVEYVSDSVERTLGYTADEFRTVPLVELI